MSTGTPIDLRFCFIGEEGVGKRSIINRFKILNCSKTIDNTSNDIKL